MPPQKVRAYTHWGRHAFTADVQAESAFEAVLLALYSFSKCGRPLSDRTGNVELTLADGRQISVRVPRAFEWLEKPSNMRSQATRARLKTLLAGR